MDDAPAIQGSSVSWAGHTTLNPLGLVMVLVCGLAMIVVSRRYAVWPMIVVVCFVASAQRVVILDLDFDLLRILVLCGWLRLFARHEFAGFTWKPIDYVLLTYASVNTITYTVLVGSSHAFINRLGFSFDAIGMYFLFRCLVRTWDDLNRIIMGFVLASVPAAAFFLIESRTGHNLFAVFGGVPEITTIRDGRLRCQGAFSHPIMAGCFWAGVLPLIAARWWSGRAAERRWVVVGGACALLVIYLCASSTPVMGVLFGVLGAALFVWRWRMRWVRWGIVLGLVALHLVMKAPVWHLISRVDIVGGSTGWHRYHLLDQAIKRFGEWWLLGTQTTAHWGAGLQDVTNHFILEGVRGGAATLGLFIAAIVLAFGGVGNMWRRAGAHRERVALSWALGVALFVHCMNFLGVSYFGQIIMVWYLTLAIIGSLTPTRAAVGQPRPARVPVACAGSQG
jgi:hypothetical protein